LPTELNLILLKELMLVDKDVCYIVVNHVDGSHMAKLVLVKKCLKGPELVLVEEGAHDEFLETLTIHYKCFSIIGPPETGGKDTVV
jgi:hypothetical protein